MASGDLAPGCDMLPHEPAAGGELGASEPRFGRPPRDRVDSRVGARPRPTGMDPYTPGRSADVAEAEIADRLQWLLRLRWLIVPVFVAVDLAYGLLVKRSAPWTALVVGAVLLAANALYSQLLSRRQNLQGLLRWARF